MNDAELDRLVAGTDLYPEQVVAGMGLADAEAELLEEIVGARTHLRRSPALAVTGVAAAVACLVAGAALLSPGHTDRVPDPAAPPVATASPTGAATPDFTAAAVRSAEAGPRLVLDAPGFTLEQLDVSSMGFHAGPTGFVTHKTNGGEYTTRRGQNVDIDWYPASSYAGYRDDRSHVSAVKEIPVLGVTGRMVTYERGDYAVMLPPADGIFVEIRMQGLSDETAFETILAQLRQVGARAWLESLPDTIVVPRVGGATTRKLLADVPLPPGFDVEKASPDAVEDYYQAGAHVTGVVACTWLDAWTTAVADGDDAARDRAVAAMSTSRGWTVLKRMNPQGDWPEVLWRYADDIAAGHAPRGFQGALGCHD